MNYCQVLLSEWDAALTPTICRWYSVIHLGKQANIQKRLNEAKFPF